MKDKKEIREILNAAVPFMPADKGRQMFYFIKAMEIMDKNEDINIFENNNEDKKTRRSRFLNSINNFITDEEKNDIEMLIKVIELKKIMG